MNNSVEYQSYNPYDRVRSTGLNEENQSLSYYKTGLSCQQIRSLRDGVVRSIEFLEQNKLQVGQNDYKNLFQLYQNILNTYNNMIDRNMIQSQYIDPRTVVQTQPIIDGRNDYELEDWEKQFTANNLQIKPYTIPPINAFRQIKDYNKYYASQTKNLQQNGMKIPY